VPDLQEVRTVTSEAPPLSRAAGLNQQTGEYGSPQSLGRRPIGRRLLKRDTWPFQESLNGGQGLGAGGRGKVALVGGCFAWATAATEVKGFAWKFPESRRDAVEAPGKSWRPPEAPRVNAVRQPPVNSPETPRPARRSSRPWNHLRSSNEQFFSAWPPRLRVSAVKESLAHP